MNEGLTSPKKIDRYARLDVAKFLSAFESSESSDIANLWPAKDHLWPAKENLWPAKENLWPAKDDLRPGITQTSLRYRRQWITL